MARYRELSSIYHKAGNNGISSLEAAYQSRFTAESTFRTGIITNGNELFLAVPHELSLLTEDVLRKEQYVSNLLQQLSPIAHASLIRSLITDEIVYTNEIEGVHSTHKQISDTLASIKQNNPSPSTSRFREFATLYLKLSDGLRTNPTTPEDIRALYDAIMDGELSPQEMPDGNLFRKDPVEIVGHGTKVIHTGVNPESAIIEYVKTLLSFIESEEMPRLYSAAIFHYVFEYIHPFYDGNGRTGRYLLALHLSRSLSISTAISLSRVIADNKNVYYRGFKSVENPLNRSEVTPFVLMILDFINQAQDDLIDKLERNNAILDEARQALKQYASDNPQISKKECEVLYQLVQVSLFGAFEDASIHNIAQHLACGIQTARKYVQLLEDKELIEVVSKRPLTFKLSEKAKEFLLP